jgi:type III secretion protein J
MTIQGYRIHFSFTHLILLLFMTCCLTSCASKKTIVHHLDEGEANEIVVFLSGNGIEAQKVQSAEAGGGGGTKVVKWDISVAEENATDAMQLLRANGLPRKTGSSLLNIFSKGGLVPSETEEKIKYQSGKAEEIANTIRKIDGVVDADVSLSFPEEDPLNPTAVKERPTASVYVKHTGVLDDPNSQLINKIRRLVSSSVQGLDFDNVTVIPDRARFSDVPQRQQMSRLEDKEYVSIWSVVVAKESLTRFRVIFFSFSIAILLLAIGLVWAIWKIYPLISQFGGIKSFFDIHPYGHEAKKQAAEKSEEENKAESAEQAPPPKPPEDEGEAT